MTQPMGSPVRRAMPWCSTSHESRPRRARTINAMLTPNRSSPAWSWRSRLVDMSPRCYARHMPEPRWLSDREMRAWLGYRRMRLLLDLQLDRDLMSHSGLSEQDYDVLSNLSDAAGQQLRLTDLAGHLRWSKSRLSHHVTRMRQRGLVDREECADDARGSMLVLTPAGRKAI